MRTFIFLALVLLPAAAFAQSDDPFAPVEERASAPKPVQRAPSSSSSSGGPWRAGLGLNSNLTSLNGNFTLNPGLALITEYCFGGDICASAAASIVAASDTVNIGNINIQNDGFDADLSGGVRVPFTGGPTELSGFGVLQLGMSNPGGNLLTELGLFFGLALEQQVWQNLAVRLSSSIVGMQTAFINNNNAFALLVTLNPSAALVARF